MRNHNEKFRDMARSALPSTAPRAARENKRHLKQRVRHYNNMRLREWMFEENAYDYEGFCLDSNDPALGIMFGYDANIQGIVDDRRNHDKLSVVRWARRLCETKYRHITDDDERYNLFKSLMPDTTAGRHILGHIGYECWPRKERRSYDFYSDDSVDELGLFKSRKYGGGTKNSNTANAEVRHMEQVHKLYDIICDKVEHRRFNNVIKAQWAPAHRREYTITNWDKKVEGGWWHSAYERITEYRFERCKYCTEEPRTIGGLGDIEAWLDYAYAAHRHGFIKLVNDFIVRRDV